MAAPLAFEQEPETRGSIPMDDRARRCRSRRPSIGVVHRVAYDATALLEVLS